MVSTELKKLAITVVALVVAIVTALHVVHAAATYTYSFKYNATVSTEDITLATISVSSPAIDSFTLYLPPGIEGWVSITVTLENPGSSDASATVSTNCLQGGSETVTVPAGSSATATFVLKVPTKASEYITCPFSSDVANITKVKIDYMYYETDVSMVYNTTHVNYTVSLFTIPYAVVGSETKFASKYNLTLAKAGTSLTNASITLEPSDDYVSASATVGDNITISITDNLPYTGRYLGTLKIVAEINQQTLNIFIKPKCVEPDNTNIPNLVIKPNVEKVIIPDGLEIKLGLINPNTVYDSGGTAYTFNYTVVRYDVLNLGELTKKIEESVDVKGYNVTYLAGGIPKNGTNVEALVLANISDWLEPLYRKFTFTTRYVNVTFTWTMPSNDVTGFINVTHVLLNGVNVTTYNNNLTGLVKVGKLPDDFVGRFVETKPSDSGYVVLRVLHENVPMYDYALRVGYVVLTTSTTVTRYVNISTIAPVPDLTVSSTTYGDLEEPILTITVNNYYERVPDVHAVVYMPAHGSNGIELSVSRVLPIRFSVTPTFRSTAIDKCFIFVISDDKKYSLMGRDVRTDTASVTVTSISPHSYMLIIPDSLNYTTINVDLSADVLVKVTWNDSSPAAGVIVELYTGTTLVSKRATDAEGKALFDPFYGSYRIIVTYGETTETYTLTLTDDSEYSVKLPVPPPPAQVTEVELVASKTEATVNETVTFTVTVKLNKAPSEEMEIGGEFRCTGASVITETFSVKVPPGKNIADAVIGETFPVEGNYVCKAIVGGVESNEVAIQVKAPGIAEMIGIPTEALIFIIVFILLLLIAGIFYLLIKASRRTRLTSYRGGYW